MEKQCENAGCTKTATQDKILDAPFSMTGTASQTQTKIKVCDACVEQDKRMEELNK